MIGAKAVTVISKTGDVLLELEVAEEELRNQWVRGWVAACVSGSGF